MARIPHIALISAVAFAAAVAVATQMNDYLLYVVILWAIFASLAVSFDVLLGYTGYLSLAHGALFGLGAYTGAIMTTRAGAGFWLALPVAGLVTAGVAMVVALIAFRTRGLYFAVLTLGIGLIGHQMFLVASGLTGGVLGFAGIPGPGVPSWLPIDQNLWNTCLALALLLVTFLAAQVFVRSRLGAACIAVREDMTLAQALGIGISRARLSAFIFSGFFTGLAGALFAAINNFVAPESFTVLGTGFQLVALVVVGGMGTLWGPILGAALLTALPEALRMASGYSMLAYGVLLLVFILFAPKGFAGLIQRGAAVLRRPATRKLSPTKEGVR
ncbi:branched-chain amino acid ABC transporter permease [Paracoccus laeviglucosivorans]|uniref:Amino acid/amide ABC transporter membrane protein 2, HAAT family n=1 Tax=Paracoccus laeviglucosivorans TaxID=1197861 RepID=A0A521FD50_9RHOB|nr:branched-chain amino acid ABC transporter permease [Paracoccus laeviglucosivorans]SMO93531.1 amino acid/amide ABC transporter membrane protein 2, HAAT family [Paracoccus laeviglucosivorans]